MKGMLSATVDANLIDYLDQLPGKTRSEKLERLLTWFKKIEEERQLRQRLRNHYEDQSEAAEREIWEETFQEAMWKE
jgi:hypothetical protein